MARRSGAGWRTGTAVLVLSTLPWAAPSAHDAHRVGSMRLEVGWGDEPAFAGIRNSVVVELSDAKTGAPVTNLGGGSLSAEVIFGNARTVLPLRQAWDRRNELRAWLVPTRTGTYTFHITGVINATSVDITSTCSERTFDCVVGTDQIQFPSRDPSAGELAERLERSTARSERTLESARRAQIVAYAALGLSALLGILMAATAMRRAKGR